MTAAVVTGLGIAAPNGLGAADYWAATLHGKSGISRVTRFDPSSYPARLAGEVPGFVPEEHLPGRLITQTDRMTQLALAATGWALTDAGVDPVKFEDNQIGVVTASGAGGYEFGENELRKLWSQGSQFVSAYQSFAWFYAVNTGQISIRHGMKGPSGVVVSDQAGGLDALAQARRMVRKGTPVMVSGGIDASICSWGWVAQLSTGHLSTSDESTRAYLPFDRDAHGYVPGEGGAMLIVEDADAAAERGARRYGELAGYGATLDAPLAGGDPTALRRAIAIALADAGLGPDGIDVVFADASGLPGPDRIEAETLAAVFGVGGVPVTAPKTMTGRLYSGAASLDVATALLALRDGVIPPTVHIDPCPDYVLDLVLNQPREADLGTALVLARGGGFNSAMVIRR